MDLRQLAYFVAAVDHQGFTRAATAVHVAQPSLSQSIRSLEAELGVDLFDRVGREVRLTAAGEALVEPARQALRDVRTARAAVAAVRDVAGGHLDLVCLPTLAVSPVADHVGAYRRRHPLVTVRLVEPEDAGALTDLVRSGRSEIGFTELPMSTGGLIEVELSSQAYVAVVPRGSQVGPRVTMAELAALPLITTPAGTSTRRLIDEAFARSGQVPMIAIETDHREVITAMVRAGGGYSILPRPVADRIARRDATVVEIRPAVTRRVGMIRREGTLSPAGRAFVDLVISPGT